MMLSRCNCCRRLSIAWSVSARIASSVTTCNTKCVPPLRSKPSWTFCFILAMVGGNPANNAIDRTVTPRIIKNRARTRLFIPSLLFRPLQRSNGAAGKLDLDVFRYPKLNAVVFNCHYRTVNPARGDDLIACLEIINHHLELLLAPTCREKHNQIKDSKDQNQG